MKRLTLRFFLALSMVSVLSAASAQEENTINKYLDLFYDYEYQDWDKAVSYLDSAKALQSTVKDPLILGKLELYQGWYHQDISNFDSCRIHFNRSLEYYSKANSYNDIADVYGNLGNVYTDVEDYATALEYQMLSLNLNEKILLLSKDEKQLSEAEKGRAYAWTNISSIFFNIGEYEKSLEYQVKGLRYEEQKGDSIGIGISFTGMASVFDDLGHVDSSIYYGELARDIFIQYEYSTGLMNTDLNLYNFYRLQDELRIEYLHEAYEIAVRFDDAYGQAASLRAMVGSDYPFPDDSMANMIAQTKVLLAEHDFEDYMYSFYRSEAIYLERKGRHKAAYDALLKYTEMHKDHLENTKEVDFRSAEVKHELELELFQDSLSFEKTLQDQKLANEKRANRQNIIITITIFGGAILAVFLLFVYRSLKAKKRNNQALSHKNTLIEHQKEIVEEKNKEITDSITYAKRLQNAILPPVELLESEFQESFIYYNPKDVVSGDFYWFEKKGDIVFIAAADCTGHGVPGAMVSVVCSNALNRSVNEFGLKSPSDILNKTRELVIKTFAKSGDNVKDGMDISLCVFNPSTNKVTFSGANNPLWICRKTDSLAQDQKENKGTYLGEEYSLIEFKSDKQPVGLYEGMKDFTALEIELTKGDVLYLFTDGYADQFGGEKGKKLKYRNFKQLLLKSAGKPMRVQEEELETFMLDWMADYDQVDDICIIGVKV